MRLGIATLVFLALFCASATHAQETGDKILVVIKPGVPFFDEVREFAIARISREVQNRVLGRVVRVPDELQHKSLEEKIKALGITRIYEFTEGRLEYTRSVDIYTEINFVHGRREIQFPHTTVRAYVSGNVLNGNTEELKSITEVAQSQGYVATDIVRIGAKVNGSEVTTEETIRRNAVQYAIAKWFDQAARASSF